MSPKPTCDCGTCEKCKRREYMRRWYARPENTDRYREIARRSRQRRLESVRAYDRTRPRRNRRDRIQAGKAVERALLSGRLVRQPCEICEATPTDAHHDDYSKPLDVRWLCRRHHGAVHQRINPVSLA